MAQIVSLSKTTAKYSPIALNAQYANIADNIADSDRIVFSVPTSHFVPYSSPPEAFPLGTVIGRFLISIPNSKSLRINRIRTWTYPTFPQINTAEITIAKGDEDPIYYSPGCNGEYLVNSIIYTNITGNPVDYILKLGYYYPTAYQTASAYPGNIWFDLSII